MEIKILLFLALMFKMVEGYCQYEYLDPEQYSEETDSLRYRYYPYYKNSSGLWGYADSTGNVLIKPRYIKIRPFFHGHAAVKIKGGWGVIDPKGRWVYKATNDSITYDVPSETMFLYNKSGKKQNGNFAKIKIFEEAKERPSEIVSLEPSEYNNTDYYKQPVERDVITMRLFQPENCDDWHLGRFVKKVKDTIENLVWQSEESFDLVGKTLERMGGKFSVVRKNGKCGLMGWDEKTFQHFMFPIEYDTIYFNSYYNSVFFGVKNGKYNLIQMDNKKRFHYTECRFDDVKTWSPVNVLVKEKGTWYVIYDFDGYSLNHISL